MEVYTEKELQCIHNIELELFKLFIEICDREKLKYYIIGGTLLGAVRHQGFIPWDDDIDVGMLRKDYEKFLLVADKYLPEHVFLQTCRTEPGYPLFFAKLRNSNTTFIESTARKANINHGVFIDIFPLDYYPLSPLTKIYVTRMLAVYHKRMIESCYKHEPSKALKKRIISYIISALLPDVKKVIEKRDSVVRSIPNGKDIINWSGAWGIKKERVPLAWFDESVQLMFEGFKVNAPKEYDAYLTQIYGDYMQLPSEEKRVSHHHAEQIDFERAYTQYRNLYGENAR